MGLFGSLKSLFFSKKVDFLYYLCIRLGFSAILRCGDDVQACNLLIYKTNLSKVSSYEI